MNSLLVLGRISQQILSQYRELEQRPVPGFLIKTGGFAFSLACVLFEKCRKKSVDWVLQKSCTKKLNIYKVLHNLICGVPPEQEMDLQPVSPQGILICNLIP